MGDVIELDRFKFPWKEAFSLDNDMSTLQVYVNERTGEAEVVQMNDDGEAIRTMLSARELYDFASVMSRFCIISNER